MGGFAASNLPAQFERNDIVSVSVNHQFRQRELRQAIDQSKIRSEQPMDRQPAVMKLGHRFDRRKCRFEDQPCGRLLNGQLPATAAPSERPNSTSRSGRIILVRVR